MKVNKDEAKNSAPMAAAEDRSSTESPNIMVGPICEQEQEKGSSFVAAAAAAAGSSAAKIKLKISRFPVEPADSVVKEFSHLCKECGKGFSSGKALGGHMSSAHVQAKDKLKARLDGDSDDEKQTCGICLKEFPSSKSLYGHMRLHPERQWRGMEPRGRSGRQLMDKVDENGYGFDSLEFSEEVEGFDADSSNEIGMAEYDVAAVVGSGWGKTGKRGQKFGVEIFDFADFADEEEKEMVIQAARELVKLARGPPPPLNLVNDESFIPSMESARYAKFPPKGRNPSQLVMHSSSDDDSEETLVSGNVPFGNGKGPIDTASSILGKDLDDGGVGRIKRRKLAGKTPNEAAQQALTPLLPEKHKCSTCNKSFSTHQALGGHRSSHNKVKIHVQNAIDQINPEEFNSLSLRLPESSEIERAGKASSDAFKVSTDHHIGYLHECEVCGKGFPTGQALGGHKRCHYTGGSSSAAQSPPPPLDEFVGDRSERKVHGFDLNVVPAEDDGDL